MMGTSRGRPDAPPRAPLVPPWADKDPNPPETPQAPEAKPKKIPVPESPAIPVPKVSPLDLAPPRRYSGFRTALGRFSKSGARDDARTALGHWARTSVGGGNAIPTPTSAAIPSALK